MRKRNIAVRSLAVGLVVLLVTLTLGPGTPARAGLAGSEPQGEPASPTGLPAINAGAGHGVPAWANVAVTDRLVSVRDGQAPAASRPRPESAPNTIIGTDQRTQITTTTSWPYRSVVWLQMDFPTFSATCSGTLIGPDVVATAAHCLYDDGGDGWATSVTVSPGQNGGTAPYGSVAAASWAVTQSWRDTGAVDSDYGLVDLGTSTLGNTTGYRALGVFSNATLGSASFQPTVTGYPGDKPDGTMWSDLTKSAFTQTSSTRLWYDIDTFGGQSGSGIYSRNSASPAFEMVVGIHAYGDPSSPYNNGRRIDAGIVASFAAYCSTYSCSFAAYSEQALNFVTQPGNGQANVVLAQQPVVELLALDGSFTLVRNTADNASVITLAVQSGPGVLTCTTSNTRTVVAGLATFSGCSLNASGVYTLKASNPLSTGKVSNTITISPADVYAVNWTTVDIPSAMVTDGQSQYRVTLVNTSNFTWPKAGPNPVYLSYHWYSGACGTGGALVSHGIQLPIPRDTAPGESINFFKNSVRGPNSAGTYCLVYDLLRSGIAWFGNRGADTPKFTVVVTDPVGPLYGATFTIHDTPATMTAGATAYYGVTLDNTGLFTWVKASKFRTVFRIHWRSGACGTGGGIVGSYAGTTTILPVHTPPGQSTGQFNVAVQAPAVPGTYCLQYDLHRTGIAYFSAKGVTTPQFTVTVN